MLMLLILCLFGTKQLGAKTNTLTGFPFLAYSNETRLMGGGFLIWQNTRDSLDTKAENTILTNAIVSANKQFLAFVLPRFSRQGGKYQLSADLLARRWSDHYWGIGNSTPEAAKEPFGWEEYKLSLAWQYRLGKHFYPSVEVDVRFSDLFDTQEDGLLSQTDLQGTTPAYYFGRGVNLLFDTVDSSSYPTKGLKYSLSYKNYATIPKSNPGSETLMQLLEPDFDKLTLDLNHYLSPIPGWVIAAQSSFAQSENATPFTFYPELGNKLRAYDSKRFIDKTLLAQRLEQRIFPAELPWLKSAGYLQGKLFRRAGLVIFSEAGQVAPHAKHYRWDRNHWSNGFGLRYAILPEEKLNFRIDFGFGEDTFNFIFQAREVF